MNRFWLWLLLVPQLIWAQRDTVYAGESEVTALRDKPSAIKGMILPVSSDALDLQSRSGKRFSETMSELPGIHLKNYGSGQLSSVAMNGASASQTIILWEGIKLNSVATGQSDLSLFTLGITDAITQKQPGEGAGIGGALALNNYLKRNSDFESTILARAGSFGNAELLGRTAYHQKFFWGRTSLSFSSSKNNFRYRDPFADNWKVQTHAATTQWSFMQELLFTIHPKAELSANVWITQGAREIPSLTGNFSTQQQYDASYRSMIRLTGSQKLWHYTISTACLQDQYRYTDWHAGIDSRLKTAVIRNQMQLHFLLKSITLKGELHYDFEKAQSSGFTSLHQRHLYGLQISAVYRFFRNMELQAGVAQDLNGGVALPTTPSLLWRWNTVHKSGCAFQVQVSAARNYRLPSFNDLYWAEGGNPNLKTEKAWNAGIQVALKFKNVFLIKVQNNYAYVTDWILWHPNTTGLWTPENLRKVFNRNVNVLLKYQTQHAATTKGWAFEAVGNYSYTRAENMNRMNSGDQSAGKQLIYVPMHLLNHSMQLSYRLFYFKTVQSYTGEQFTSTDNAASLPGFYLLHLEAGKTFRFAAGQLRLSFRVNNVLDTHYQLVALYPMPGRGFEGTLQFNLAR
ncbi:MAG: hypothetical protein U0T73_09765 [Chitinophagales bacterium]